MGRGVVAFTSPEVGVVAFKSPPGVGGCSGGGVIAFTSLGLGGGWGGVVLPFTSSCYKIPFLPEKDSVADNMRALTVGMWREACKMGLTFGAMACLHCCLLYI